MPSFLLSFILNDRRTAYAGVAFAILSLIVMTPISVIKKNFLKLTAAFLVAMSMLVTSSVMFFAINEDNAEKPYSKEKIEDLSYREVENANLYKLVVDDPVTGIGFGNEMSNVFGLIDIEEIYPRYKTFPHNQLVAFWGYGGSYVVAFMSLIFTLMLALSLRPYHMNYELDYKVIGTTLYYFYIQYLVFTMADLGYQIVKLQLFAGLGLGGLIRLCYLNDHKGAKKYAIR